MYQNYGPINELLPNSIANVSTPKFFFDAKTFASVDFHLAVPEYLKSLESLSYCQTKVWTPCAIFAQAIGFFCGPGCRIDSFDFISSPISTVGLNCILKGSARRLVGFSLTMLLDDGFSRWRVSRL
jgi:hypothetical protein